MPFKTQTTLFIEHIQTISEFPISGQEVKLHHASEIIHQYLCMLSPNALQKAFDANISLIEFANYTPASTTEPNMRTLKAPLGPWCEEDDK